MTPTIGGKVISMAVEWGYDFRGFEGYPGNVGSFPYIRFFGGGNMTRTYQSAFFAAVALTLALMLALPTGALAADRGNPSDCARIKDAREKQKCVKAAVGKMKAADRGNPSDCARIKGAREKQECVKAAVGKIKNEKDKKGEKGKDDDKVTDDDGDDKKGKKGREKKDKKYKKKVKKNKKYKNINKSKKYKKKRK
ncbi:MAG: hypothetical protein V3V55_07990 [Rhodospirillales bacterium]